MHAGEILDVDFMAESVPAVSWDRNGSAGEHPTVAEYLSNLGESPGCPYGKQALAGVIADMESVSEGDGVHWAIYAAAARFVEMSLHGCWSEDEANELAVIAESCRSGRSGSAEFWDALASTLGKVTEAKSKCDADHDPADVFDPYVEPDDLGGDVFDPYVEPDDLGGDVSEPSETSEALAGSPAPADEVEDVEALEDEDNRRRAKTKARKALKTERIEQYAKAYLDELKGIAPPLSPLNTAGLWEGDIDDEPPTVLTVDVPDGHDYSLFERGATHSLNGDTGSGKSWAATLAAVQEIGRGNSVVYIDCEDRAVGVIGRLRSAGVGAAEGRERFHYLRPHGAWSADDVAELIERIAKNRTTLVVLDGVTDALSMLGLSSNLDTDVAELFSVFGGKIAAAGPAVVFIDHLSQTTTGTQTRGSGHKVGGLSGSAFFVDSDPAFPMGRGMFGVSHISFGTKTRGGWLVSRGVKGPKGRLRIARLVVDATGQVEDAYGNLRGPVVMTLTTPAADDYAAKASLALAEKEYGERRFVLEVIKEGETLSQNEILRRVRNDGNAIPQGRSTTLFKDMVDEGLLSREGKGLSRTDTWEEVLDGPS